MLTLPNQLQAIKVILYRSGNNHVINHANEYCWINSLNNKLPAMMFIAIYLLLSPVTFAKQSASIAVFSGVFDITNDNDNAALEIGIEYHFVPLSVSAYKLIPTVGLTVNADKAYWLYGGVRYDIYLYQKWVLIPNWAISFYNKGDSTDLGSNIEFRTGLELAYKLSTNSHLGVGIYHLSNAGLENRNPGSNSIILSYSFSPCALK